MEEGHASSNVSGKGKPEVPVQRDVVVHQHVIQTALGAVLTDDGHVGRGISECDSDELADVGVLQVPVHPQNTH